MKRNRGLKRKKGVFLPPVRLGSFCRLQYAMANMAVIKVQPSHNAQRRGGRGSAPLRCARTRARQSTASRPAGSRRGPSPPPAAAAHSLTQSPHPSSRPQPATTADLGPTPPICTAQHPTRLVGGRCHSAFCTATTTTRGCSQRRIFAQRRSSPTPPLASYKHNGCSNDNGGGRSLPVHRRFLHHDGACPTPPFAQHKHRWAPGEC